MRDELLVLLQLHNHHFDRLIAGIDVRVHRPRSIRGQPVGLPALPHVRLARAGLLDDLHRAALERDDDASGSWRCMVRGACGTTIDFHTFTSSFSNCTIRCVPFAPCCERMTPTPRSTPTTNERPIHRFITPPRPRSENVASNPAALHGPSWGRMKVDSS